MKILYLSDTDTDIDETSGIAQKNYYNNDSQSYI